MLALSTIIITISCKKENNLFSLEANLTNISDSTLFYLESLKTSSKIDSGYIVNGSLYLEGQLQHPEKLFLFAIDAKSKEFIYTYLFVENEQVTLKSDKRDFPWNIDVFGSFHQDQAEMFNQIMYQRQEIIKELNLTHNSEKELLSKKITQAKDSLDDVTVKLIKKHFNSYAALDFFKHYKTKFSNEELSSLYDKLDLELKETISGKSVKLQSKYSNPKVGDKYYDYSAINQHGDTVALSDIKDKYILLHFSSSACYPSQLSLTELKKIYQHHGNDLEIVSISEDFNREHWLNTVKVDSIPWIYLWDGKGEFNDAVIKYWEIGTPNYVFISPDKIILEKWFGYRDGIFEEKLKEYLN